MMKTSQLMSTEDSTPGARALTQSKNRLECCMYRSTRGPHGYLHTALFSDIFYRHTTHIITGNRYEPGGHFHLNSIYLSIYLSTQSTRRPHIFIHVSINIYYVILFLLSRCPVPLYEPSYWWAFPCPWEHSLWWFLANT